MTNLEIIKAYLDVHAQMDEQIAAGPGLRSPARFMLEHGRAFKVTPMTYAGRRGIPKSCYMNAGRGALVRGTPLLYAEGYVTTCGIPIPHGFLVNRSGEVIDPTLKGDEEPVRAYFGLVFTAAHVRESTSASGYWSLLEGPTPTRKAIIEGRGDQVLARLEDA